MHKDQIPGGKADDKKPEDFNKADLKEGIKVEKEHTGNTAVAQEIAMDHMTEFPKYYPALKKMEAKLEKAAEVIDLLISPRRII